MPPDAGPASMPDRHLPVVTLGRAKLFFRFASARVAIDVDSACYPLEVFALTFDDEVGFMQIHPWLALGVVASTAATDAVYVMFSSAVANRRRLPAASWSSVWYLLSAFAVISYTRNWVYVCFAAVGSWLGAYLSMTVLHRSAGDRGEPKPSN